MAPFKYKAVLGPNKTLVESVQLGKTLDSVFVSPSTGERVKCDEKGGGLCKVE